MTQQIQTIPTLEVAEDHRAREATVSRRTDQDAASEPQVATGAAAYHKMRKSIRTWAWWMLGWAGYSALLGSNVPWAAVLAVTACVSFYLSDAAAMFIVYTGILLWAAIFNVLLAGDVGWAVFGIIQLILAISTARDYRKYRALMAEIGPERPDVDGGGGSQLIRRESTLPALSIALGALGALGVCSIVPTGLWLASSGAEALPPFLDIALSTTWELGILALPVGAAALLSSHRLRAAAVAGLVLGFLSALTFAIFMASAA